MEFNQYSVPTITCPYVGMKDDPGTSFAYPSMGNHCHHCQPPANPLLKHQGAFCLTVNHSQCPLFKREGKFAMPRELRESEYGPNIGKQTLQKIALVVGIILIGFLGAWFILNRIGPGSLPAATNEAATATIASATLAIPSETSTSTPTKTLPPTATLNLTTTETRTPTSPRTPTLTRTPTPTSTLTRTQTPTSTSTRTATLTPIIPPTTTLTPHGLGLEVPLGLKKQFLLHRVLLDESLALYASKYNTTEDAIIAINYALQIPVWVNWVVVIPLGITDVKDFPPFESYRIVGERIMIEALAKKLNVDANALVKYNALVPGFVLWPGDWVLIPR